MFFSIDDSQLAIFYDSNVACVEPPLFPCLLSLLGILLNLHVVCVSEV